MDIDLNALFNSIKSAVESQYDERSPIITEVGKGYVQGTQTRFATYTEQAAIGEENGGISPQFLIDRIAEEPKILESQLISFEIIGEVEGQTLLNRVLQVVLDFVSGVVKNIIPQS